MNSDLKTMTRKQLEKLRADVDIALARAIERERKEALAAVEKAAKAHGFTLAEIAENIKVTKTTRRTRKTTRKVSKQAKPKAVSKFANPENKSQTWSGKGRKPEWFKAALASGKKAEELRA